MERRYEIEDIMLIVLKKLNKSFAEKLRGKFVTNPGNRLTTPGPLDQNC